MRRNMARQPKRLTARTVATMTRPGRHADGGNLYLTISRTGAAVSKRWTFMFSFAGKQREAGFGPPAAVPLAEAREKAARYRSMLASWTQRRLPRMLLRPAKHSASALMNS